MSDYTDDIGFAKSDYTDAWFARIVELETAIREHGNTRADDRCWEDDQKLYAVLHDPNFQTDNTMPAREAHLANCARYYDRRCQGGVWKTYQELEAELVAFPAAVEQAVQRERQMWKNAIQIILRNPADLNLIGSSDENDVRRSLQPVAESLAPRRCER